MKNSVTKLIIAISSACLFFLSRADAVTVNAVPMNIQGNVQVSTMTFDMAYSSDSFKLSNQYIQLFYETYNTGMPWRADIYTNNTGADASLIERGGLIGASTNTIFVPLAWSKSSGIVSSPSTVDITNGSANGWQWVKDKTDADWAASYNANATTIASSLNSSSSATYYIYLEADFYGASAADYGTTVWVDLYQTIDSVAPYIYSTPVSNIDSVGNDLTLQATVTDDNSVAGCSLFYNIGGTGWVEKALVASSTSTATNKFYSYTISAQTIGSASQISYCFVATDGFNFAVAYGQSNVANLVINRDQTSFTAAVVLGETTPQQIAVGDYVTFPSLSSGYLFVPDGNPYDGNTSLTIPTGALSSPVSITITQMDSNSQSNALQSPSARAVDTITNLNVKPVAIYDFTSEPAILGFKIPATMSLLFLADANGVVHFPDGKVFPGVKKSDLKAYWWDGFDWRILGGKLDDKANTLTFRTENLGKYAIFLAPPLSASDFRPKEKIITPNGDGKNDYALFGNLNGQDYSIDIFDIKGHKVKTITTSSLPRWDGTDDGGRVVESGVYLYQFKADVNGSSKLISGTIVVAK